MHYYKFNIADYRKDTGHLSTLEHGIYRQLIDWYYLDEQPIPAETQVVARRLRLASEMDLHSLNMVLSDFFVLGKNGYVHKRIEVEIKDYHEQADKNKTNGKLGGRPKKTQSVISGLPDESQNNPNHKPLTINQEPNLTVSKDTVRPPTGEPEEKQGSKLPGCDHKGVLAIYHSTLPNLPTVEIWNDTRAGYLRQRWREVALDLAKDGPVTHEDVLGWWKQFFRHVGNSKFLTGKTQNKDKPPFLADLEWIIRPTNFAKIIEGKYHRD
jgi:uncharacterized protein YdaU (DUF1376 family)